MTNEVLHGLLRTKPTVLTESGSGTAYIQTSIRLPMDLSDEASQAAEGGRAVSYTHLTLPTMAVV